MSNILFKEINGVKIPFQNNIALPTFDAQDREVFSLEGIWKKKRFSGEQDFSMALRDKAWIEKTCEPIRSLIDEYLNKDTLEQHIIPLPENKLSGEEKPKAAENYEDGVWYIRSFSLNRELRNKAITLKALGINYVCDLWINEKYVGNHEGGFTPFAFDVTNYIDFTKENMIIIRVDNPAWGKRDDIIPAVPGTDFFNYTGIIQELYFEVSSVCHIVRTDITPLDIEGNIEVKAVIENSSDKKEAISIYFSIFEGNKDAYMLSPKASSIKGVKVLAEGLNALELIMEPKEVRAIILKAKLKEAKLWSLKDPNLYVLEMSLTNNQGEKDSLCTQFGIRTLKTKEARILLNENPIFLAGIARHEEWPNYGRTATWERIKEDLNQIYKLNANMVRTGHYPNHVYTYILLDRLGLAAMSELPLWQFEEKHYKAQEERKTASNMWREMIFSQFNRPSVFMWSTQNESSEVALRKKHNENLIKDLRENYNDGRLVTQSAAADRPGYFDPSMEPLDVAAWTMYFGIFHGGKPYEGTKEFLEKAHKAWPDKPLLNTEYGYWSREDNSEEQLQVSICEDTLKALFEKASLLSNGELNPEGYLAGVDYWIMYNWYVNHNDWVQTMGLYHMDRETLKPIGKLIEKYYYNMIGENAGVYKASSSQKEI